MMSECHGACPSIPGHVRVSRGMSECSRVILNGINTYPLSLHDRRTILLYPIMIHAPHVISLRTIGHSVILGDRHHFP